ncbi:MAG: hypothetical protein AMS16_02995 [Planctomycetes bacterium DG_58]|nr:MAG: hypothetical protein AMS16_02995 [Planctomycetes bacterium DG_58]
MEKIRFGVVGTGGIGHMHLGYLSTLDRVEVTCVCDIRKEVVKEVAKTHNVPAFTDSRKLIRSGLCDAVLIGTPHYEHATIGIDAAGNGIHVLTEKPMAVQVSMADKLIEACKKNKVKLGVMFQRRAHPMWKKAKSVIDSGALGELVRTCMIEPHFRTQAYYDSGGWRATWSGEGGGVMMNQAPHSLDAFVWLGGMPCKVFGKCDTRAHKIEVEDTASALLTYRNGATGYITTNTFEFPPVSLFQFVGEEAILEIRDGKLRLGVSSPGAAEFIYSTDEPWSFPVPAWTDVAVRDEPHGHRFITENFVRAVLDGEPILATGESARDSLELANAITVSSAQGKEVDIPLKRSLFDNVLKKYVRDSKFRKDARKTKKLVIPKTSSDARGL